MNNIYVHHFDFLRPPGIGWQYYEPPESIRIISFILTKPLTRDYRIIISWFPFFATINLCFVYISPKMDIPM